MKGASPYEILFGVKPRYNHLKPFGCLSYIKTPAVNRTKFSLRASPCIFLGYPFGKNAYKFLNTKTNTIHIARGATFYETIFPFIHCSSSQFIPLPVSDTHIPTHDSCSVSPDSTLSNTIPLHDDLLTSDNTASLTGDGYSPLSLDIPPIPL